MDGMVIQYNCRSVGADPCVCPQICPQICPAIPHEYGTDTWVRPYAVDIITPINHHLPINNVREKLFILYKNRMEKCEITHNTIAINALVNIP